MAQLFEVWFNSPAYHIYDQTLVTPNSPYNDTIIKMDWILGGEFARVNKKYEELLSPAMYQTTNAKKRISELLNNSNFVVWNSFDKSTGYFGHNWSSLKPTVRHSLHAQYVKVPSSIGIMDSLDAALHRFGLYSLIAGTKCGKLIQINKLGIYLKDSFDFSSEDNQHLGYWSEPDNVSYVLPNGGHKIGNETFRKYQDIFGKGGDFFVFSDIKIEELSEPILVEIDK